jgi:hypothetical protein
MILHSVTLVGQRPLKYRYDVTSSNVGETPSQQNLLAQATTVIEEKGTDTSAVNAFQAAHRLASPSMVAWLTLLPHDSAGGVALHVIVDSTSGALRTPPVGAAAPGMNSSAISFDVFVEDGRVQPLVSYWPWLNRIPSDTFLEDLRLLIWKSVLLPPGSSAADSTILDETLPSMGALRTTRTRVVVRTTALSDSVIDRHINTQTYDHDGFTEANSLETRHSRYRLIYGPDGLVSSLIGNSISNALSLTLQTDPEAFGKIVTTRVTRLQGP